MNSTVLWPLTDHQGTVRGLIDSQGNQRKRVTYDTFGNRLSVTNNTAGGLPAVDVIFGYTGQQYDPETGLYHYDARYYDPATGRFTQLDPIGHSAGDPNLYRYVGNDPLNHIDPSGLFGRSLATYGASSISINSAGYDYGSTLSANAALTQGGYIPSYAPAYGASSINIPASGYGSGSIRPTNVALTAGSSVAQRVSLAPNLNALPKSIVSPNSTVSTIPFANLHSPATLPGAVDMVELMGTVNESYDFAFQQASQRFDSYLQQQSANAELFSNTWLSQTNLELSLASMVPGSNLSTVLAYAADNTGSVLQLASATVLGTLGAAAVLAPEPTGLTKAGGALLLGFAADNYQAAVRGLANDEYVPTALNQSYRWTATSLGATEWEASQFASTAEGITYLATVGVSAVSVPSSTGARFGPHVAGPLPAEVAGTFRGGSYSQVALESETVLYRVYGGEAQPLRSWWSRTAPQGPLQARMDLALPPGNTAQNVVQIRVPQGTTVFEGAAGPNFGQLGGGNQVYIPRVDPSWVVQP